jgi:hypothetical protein
VECFQGLRDFALKLDPKLAGSLYGRGVARFRKGEQASSNADLSEAKALQTNIADEFARYGVKLESPRAAQQGGRSRIARHYL